MPSEVIRKGKVYRVLTDAVNQVWDKLSFWTHADDVYFDDDDSLSEKLGGGLVDDMSEIAAITEPGSIPDCLAIKELNNNLLANNNPFKFAYDSASQKYGYTIPVGGADTFFPFNKVVMGTINSNIGSSPVPVNCGFKPTMIIVVWMAYDSRFGAWFAYGPGINYGLRYNGDSAPIDLTASSYITLTNNGFTVKGFAEQSALGNRHKYYIAAM